MDEIIIKDNTNKKNIADIVLENKDYIYPALFYVSGLIIGSFFFSYINKETFAQALETVFKISVDNIYSLFINRFCVYFSLFTLAVLLGLCLVGFPFINSIPFFVGIEIGLKISYYYVNYSAKGIGYSLLMIIPEIACFMTLLIYTIKASTNLSKSIYSITMKKTDIISEINLKLYLKSFLVYALIVILISAINAAAEYLLSTIITI